MQAQWPPTKVEFDGLLVIVGGGTVDGEVLRELAAAGAHLVGADGGADRIAAAGLMPELIVGDLDSVSSATGWPEGTRVLPVAEQETTDFEKALYSTAAPVTVAVGMTGRRFDHTLAALDAVTRHAAERRIVLVDEEDIALALTDSFSFAVGAGERVSVHPLGPVRFRRSEGLRYPLNGLLLAPGVRTGTSNEALEGRFVIEPEESGGGPYLLILPRRYLLGLVSALVMNAG